MIYEDFVRTLLARMGLPFQDADAGAARDGVDRLVRLSAMVDDLLAEAGYDTLFDTREKGLEALRQDIKVKLGTALNEAQNQLAAERKKWPELKAEVDHLRARTCRLSNEMLDLDKSRAGWIAEAETLKQQSIDLRFKIARLVGLGLTLPSAEALLTGLEARLKGLTDMALRLEADAIGQRDKLARALGMNASIPAFYDIENEAKKLKVEVARLKKLVRNHELTISLLGKIILGHADPGAVMRDAETGEVAHIAPDVREALTMLFLRLKTAEQALVAEQSKPRWLAVVPIDRDRIRLALLDYTENHAYAHLINDLADHLVKRLKT